MDTEELKVEPLSDMTDFDRIAEALTRRLSGHGHVDLEAYDGELSSMSKPISNSIDPNVLANDLYRIQGFRDRAVAIVDIMTRLYLDYKRVVEILVGGWPRYSMAKSAEMREGEAKLKFSRYIMAASDVESTYRHALGVMSNLESQQENVFRQITCASVSSRIGQRPGDVMSGWSNYDAPPLRVTDGPESGEEQ